MKSSLKANISLLWCWPWFHIFASQVCNEEQTLKQTRLKLDSHITLAYISIDFPFSPYLLQLMFSACVAAVKCRPVLHHRLAIFVWSLRITDCICFHLKIGFRCYFPNASYFPITFPFLVEITLWLGDIYRHKRHTDNKQKIRKLC